MNEHLVDWNSIGSPRNLEVVNHVQVQSIPINQVQSIKSILAIALLFLLNSAIGNGQQVDPLNPPATLPNNAGGYWEYAGGSDDRNTMMQGSGNWAEWVKSSWWWSTSYYLRGYVTGTYNQLSSGNCNFGNELDRDFGVQGPYIVSITPYWVGMPGPQQSILPNQHSIPPYAGWPLTVKTTQAWNVQLRIRIPTWMWDPMTGQPVYLGLRDMDVVVYVNSALSTHYYRYVP